MLLRYIKLIFKNIDNILASFFIFLLKIRQKTFSPDKGLFSFLLKGKICVHYPHCSQYCINSLKRFGFFKGIEYCFSRVISCHPFGKENKFFIGNKVYDPEMYRVVFFSSSEIGKPFLKELFEDKRFEVVGVVTTPPKPAGRGLKLTPTPIQKFVEDLGKNVENFLKVPSKLKGNEEFKNRLLKLNPDFIVVISYGKIIPNEILLIPKIAPINVHGSLLPKYRGASPIQSVLLNGDTETGITIMKMNDKLDEGNIIRKLKFKIPFDWTSKDIINKIIEVGPKFLLDTMFDYAKGNINEVIQDHDKATYCKKIVKDYGKINPFKDNLDLIYRKYRAFILWPGIYFEEDLGSGKRLFKITYLKLDENKFENFKYQPLFLNENGKFKLNPAVIDIKIRPEGKKDLTFNEFLRGYFK